MALKTLKGAEKHEARTGAVPELSCVGSADEATETKLILSLEKGEAVGVSEGFTEEDRVGRRKGGEEKMGERGGRGGSVTGIVPPFGHSDPAG